MTAVLTDMTNTRPARWMMPVLVGSLALNLIVIGAIGSLLWRSHSESTGRGPACGAERGRLRRDAAARARQRAGAAH